MTEPSLAARLSLWGVDRPPAYPNMLLDFIEGLARAQARPPLPASPHELDQRRAPLRRRIRRSLGLDPWPERTPLRSQSAGIIERAGYRLEKLIYEAWPGLPITAHLYLPSGRPAPVPGIVYACGHWVESSKLAQPIQAFGAAAARLGLATLIFDPIGQGERFATWRDHAHLNALLVGSCQLGLMVWETLRGLDLLAARSEVDPTRLGLTGASGGGLNAIFTLALDERLACAVPVAYPCTFELAMRAERDLNWEDGADLCNQVPEIMSYADMSDLAALFIPRPILALACRRDRMFPITGARQFAHALCHSYALAGAPERCAFAEADEEHGYPRALREAAYGWFLHWLAHEGDGSPVPEVTGELFPDPYPVTYIAPPMPSPARLHDQSPTSSPLPGAQLAFCRPPAAPLPTAPRIDQLLRERAAILPGAPSLPGALSVSANPLDADAASSSAGPIDALPAATRDPSSGALSLPAGATGALPGTASLPAADIAFSAWQAGLRVRILDVLGPFPPMTPLSTRLYNQVSADGLQAERVVFKSEPEILIPGLFVMPAEWRRPLPAVVYVGEWGKAQGLASGRVAELVDAGCAVLAIDVRGVGETAASDFEASTDALMLDRPLFGQRVWDVLRALDWLWERCYIAPQIDKGRLVLAGEGTGALVALYAAALDRRVAALLAGGLPVSYTALLDHDANFPASVYLFDVLRHFDIPDLVAALAPRPAWLRPVDPHRRPMPAASVPWQRAAAAYELAGRKDALSIATEDPDRAWGAWLQAHL